MQRSVKQLFGYSIEATDGAIGHARDLYFDDVAWKVRYLVVDTGNWLTGRCVLLSPVALDRPAWQRKVLPVRLSRRQVESSPDISTDLPVSRQHEVELFRYYSWPLYWGGDDVAGPAAVPIVPSPEEEERRPSPESRGDPHLRSAREVLGYHIRAVDGEIGHLDDLLLDDIGWPVDSLVLDTSNWPGGKKVQVSTDEVLRLEWAERKVYLRLKRDDLRKSRLPKGA